MKLIYKNKLLNAYNKYLSIDITNYSLKFASWGKVNLYACSYGKFINKSSFEVINMLQNGEIK